MAATQPPGSGITLYAELLSNIRQVSVVATLASASDAATKAQVVEGGTAIRIHHHGHTQSLALPAPAAAPGSLPIPTHPSTQLSWRIPVSTQVPKVSSFSLENQALPWNAVDIQTAAAIRCRKCDHAIVEEGAITSWKDLPSENWAEMMEFWHCHKPHDHGDEEGHGHDRPDDEHLTKRGYGASNAISAKSGVGFVDITSFMFSEADCNGLSFSSSSLESGFDMSRLAMDESQTSKYLHVYCKSCSTEVGLYNVLASSVSLFKWQVLCSTVSPCPAPSSLQCLAATLTATISRSGSSKSVILPHSISPGTRPQAGDSRRALRLWVLNPNVTYASSLVEGKRNAMKILWQTIDAESGNKLADSITSDIQDISLPSSVIETAHDTLESSNLYLPAKERSFKEWNVGLLERWDASNSSQSNG